jgi:cold shock protein
MIVPTFGKRKNNHQLHKRLAGEREDESFVQCNH